ncbi:KinB-signaling pathway activation protein [Paenibacillus sp. J45TS6]|uniref:KinB-signaling pathway activation protein n=1 Tax=unclassified Paenibacillus TaxID=185978 RepID=UPI001B26E90B|nr:KinB-signaling pathway activation protein [Paenibacillus sp. J45TS6]GIP45862.1 KinB-signaling pathway activation protein [Paenibacillus sp. J45TS6]
MNLRKWFNLFWQTLCIGGIASLLTGLILTTGEYKPSSTADFLLYLLILFGAGMMISVYSQLGFFAYLILNYMGRGTFSIKTWNYIQLALTILALLELMFFRIFMDNSKTGFTDMLLSFIILATALVTAYFKVKATNSNALIPTLFFMIALTIVETIGVLNIGENAATTFTVIPLLACNTYQILMLHRIVSRTDSKAKELT